MEMAPLGKGAMAGKSAAPLPPLHAEGKENIAPDGEQGLVGSPLPEGFPRKALQDITLVLQSDNIVDNTLVAGAAKGKTSRSKDDIALLKTTARKTKGKMQCNLRNGLEPVVLVTRKQTENESPTVVTSLQNVTSKRETKEKEQCDSRSALEEQVALIASPKTQQAVNESQTVETLDNTKQSPPPSSATVHCEQTANQWRQTEDKEKAPAPGGNDECQDAAVVPQKKKRKSQSHPQTRTAAKPKQSSSSRSILKFR